VSYKIYNSLQVGNKSDPKIVIVIYIISGIKAILRDSSVKIADDEGVSPRSSVTHEFPVICFSPRVMYNILSTAANY
jgi:hypothetical protein